MWPNQVSNPGPVTYASGALPTALHGPEKLIEKVYLGTLQIMQEIGKAISNDTTTDVDQLNKL